MKLGSRPHRAIAVVMAFAILMVGAPMLPANATTDCDQMAMTMPAQMTMDMKSAATRPHEMPEKPGLPCSDGLSCLGAAGCASLSADQAPAAYLPRIGLANANWTNRLAGPAVAYKPALPPPIV
jgi:hypothetical protein